MRPGHESSQTRSIVPYPEVVEAGFCVSFFADEFVVIGIAPGHHYLAAVRVIVRFLLDHADVAGDNIGRAQVVSKIVMHRSTANIPPRYSPAVEENVLLAKRSTHAALRQRIASVSAYRMANEMSHYQTASLTAWGCSTLDLIDGRPVPPTGATSAELYSIPETEDAEQLCLLQRGLSELKGAVGADLGGGGSSPARVGRSSLI
jgi:hypothetical protein